MGNKKTKTKRPRLELEFDEKARKDFLTGFQKRKKERRQFGLAMQKIKDRKQRLDERKEKRSVAKEKLNDLGLGDKDLSFFDLKAKRRRDVMPDPNQEETVTGFEDDATRAMFGGDVIVTTTFGIENDKNVDELDSEIREYKKLKLENVNAESTWSLAAVTKRVASNMPRRTKRSGLGCSINKIGDPKKGGSIKQKGRELLANAKGVSRGAKMKNDKGKGKGRRKGNKGK